jgi:hypothetical protein
MAVEGGLMVVALKVRTISFCLFALEGNTWHMGEVAFTPFLVQELG